MYNNRIYAEDLVKEFKDKIEGTELESELQKTKDFSLKSIKDIVYTPFDCIRQDLDKNIINVHRRLYLGTFYCSVKKAKYFLRSLEKTYEKGNVEEKRYHEVKKMLKEFIKRKEE